MTTTTFSLLVESVRVKAAEAAEYAPHDAVTFLVSLARLATEELKRAGRTGHRRSDLSPRDCRSVLTAVMAVFVELAGESAGDRLMDELGI